MAAVLDPSFGPPWPLPYRAGESPFRQKGNGYIGDFEYLDANVPGGRKAVLATLASEPQLRTFLEQRFFGSEWYDAYPCTALHAAAARMRGLSFAEHRRQVGAYHARAAMNAIYRALLRIVSNESISLWAPRISSIYFEFGKSETRAVGSNTVVGTRRGVPAGLVQFVAFASKGFCETALQLAGAKSASLEVGEVEADGKAHGRTTYKIGMTIRWA